MTNPFPPDFDVAKAQSDLAEIIHQTLPGLVAVLKNCDFIQGTGDDASSMMAVQDVLLQNLILEIMSDRGPLERLVFWKIVLDMLMGRG